MFCLITGSSRGLGRVIALDLGRDGHHVAVHYRESITEAEKVFSRIGNSLLLRADAGKYSEVKAAADKVISEWGRIDLLVNNAGMTRELLLVKTGEEDFDEIIAANLKGPMNFTKAVSEQMIKQKQGHIVNIGSLAGMRGRAGLSAYTAAKSGLRGLTLSSARELGRFNVMVNMVLPGFMLTDMGRSSKAGARESALTESLVNEFSDPEGVARFIRYLSGTRGITGQVFNLDSRIL
jgi:3-oxoacyl-[acyl-carrier protein] reductase